MLGKLIKHEFKGSARIMVPFIIASLGLSVMAGFSFKGMSSSMGNNTWFRVMFGLIIAAFVCGLVALGVMTVVVIVERFRKNLLCDEGYLMFTLPVTVDAHIWSKLIVSSVWALLTGITGCVALLIAFGINAEFYINMSYTIANINEVWSTISDLVNHVGVGNLIGYLAEGVVLGFIICYVQCLHFYCAMAVGYSFDNRKLLLSVVAYLTISFVLSLVETGILNIGISGLDWFDLRLNDYSAVHIFALSTMLYYAVNGAILYLPTRVLLKNKLNLP